MIDFKDIFLVMRNIVINRLGVTPYENIKVIQLSSTGTKPNELYATVDLLTIQDSAGYVTGNYYDDVNEHWVYVTHKDIQVRLSVRNGNPSDNVAQMDVYTLCNHLNKAFSEDDVKIFLKDNLNASVDFTGNVISLSEVVAEGLGNVASFDLTISMPDVTNENKVAIENVDLGDFTVSDGVVSNREGNDD